MNLNEIYLQMLKERVPNLYPDDTALNQILFVSTHKDIHHNEPRLKVSTIKGKYVKAETVSVLFYRDNRDSIFENDLKPGLDKSKFKRLSSKDKKNIFDFIKKNKEILLKYWDDLIDIEELKLSLKPYDFVEMVDNK